MNTKGNAFLEALKDKTLVRHDKTTTTGADLIKEKEFILVYVGASFLSGVYKRNVANLKKFYENMKNEKLEIIYLSQDNDQKEFEKHFHELHGNWYGVPPTTKANEELMKALGYPSFPHVIVFNKLGIMCRRTTGTKDLETKGILEKWRARKHDVHKRSLSNVPSQESQESKDEDEIQK